MEKNEKQFYKEIELAVENIISASHKLTKVTLDQAFNQLKSKKRQTVFVKTTNNVGKIIEKRSAEELANLRERFHKAVCEYPGQTMKILSAKLNLEVRELHFPAVQLRTQGKIKIVGNRQFTRYFPRTDSE